MPTLQAPIGSGFGFESTVDDVLAGYRAQLSLYPRVLIGLADESVQDAGSDQPTILGGRADVVDRVDLGEQRVRVHNDSRADHSDPSAHDPGRKKVQSEVPVSELDRMPRVVPAVVAGDYVEAMWLMLQQDQPDDYVVATGESHSVQELVELAFSYAGLDWHEYVVVDPTLKRPAEVDLLLGDARKAQERLGWSPKVRFTELIRMMVESDLVRCRALAGC